MSTIVCDAYKSIGRSFHNEVQMIRLTWDFDSDGGTMDDVFKLATTTGKVQLLDSSIHVVTSLTSQADAGVVTIGVIGGDTGFLLGETNGIAADLVADTCIQETSGQGVILPAGTSIGLTVLDDNLIGGRINVTIRFVNAE